MLPLLCRPLPWSPRAYLHLYPLRRIQVNSNDEVFWLFCLQRALSSMQVFVVVSRDRGGVEVGGRTVVNPAHSVPVCVLEVVMWWTLCAFPD